MGVVSNQWFDRVLTFNSLQVQTLLLTDVQTPFLGTPLAHLKTGACFHEGALLQALRGRLLRLLLQALRSRRRAGASGSSHRVV